MLCLRSEHIVKLHRTFQTDTKLFLLLEYVAGGDLFFLLRRTNRFPGALNDHLQATPLSPE